MSKSSEGFIRNEMFLTQVHYQMCKVKPFENQTSEVILFIYPTHPIVTLFIYMYKVGQNIP